MKRDVKEFVMQCEVRQRKKTETVAPTGLLQPLPINTQVQGKDTILVVVTQNMFTFWPWLTLSQQSSIARPTIPNHTVKQRLLIVAWRPIYAAEFWFNTNYSASTKMSSFKALYGCDPPLLLKGTTIPSKVQSTTTGMGCTIEGVEGKPVQRPIIESHARSLARKPNEKLKPGFYGPYTKNHPVFHVSLLKRAVQPTSSVQALPTTLTKKLILDIHLESCWEAAATISKELPTFHLENKMKLHGGGIDRFNGEVYVRRNKIRR
ncbi:hypothetical protein V8G54_030591 [Vigna mungo]|uniref:Uncharacterized protein n=1 Tax=Vigna mungo TaxID=3915 RepID=A0AAQ3RNS2_VIGMU